MVFVYRCRELEWSEYTILCIGVETYAWVPNSPPVDVSLFSSPFSTHLNYKLGVVENYKFSSCMCFSFFLAIYLLSEVSITFTRYFNGLCQKNIFLATMKKEE
ncbi:hypothetical protein DVH24_024312 [Malus domestica]|uniref:Uncharacterized protein n=1 Tax=Malus domestica TaxID=3750 RepID=A0A498JG30_MALDO|nr:hypothetical protein DVH24_024312 [Malus domestica]